MALLPMLPVRFADDLRVEVDPHASGAVLTPSEAIALGERLIHQGARRAAELRKLRVLAEQHTGSDQD